MKITIDIEPTEIIEIQTQMYKFMLDNNMNMYTQYYTYWLDLAKNSFKL